MTNISFSSLKRSAKNNLDTLAKQLEKQNSSNTSYEDNRFWEPEVDKAGNGYAVIRFLPAPAVDGEEGIPWVTLFTHGFQGPGGWYIENSLTTLGQKDPVSDYNTKLWNSGIEANKDIARKQKRKLRYISNILVISDPKHPENDGKLFLFRYGKKIFDKINEAMVPPEGFVDETPVNPFDFWNGANFKLKIRKVDGYRNYDKSEFEKPSALYDGDDAKLEELWKKEYSLKEFLDKKNFKSYEQLKTRLDTVLGAPKGTTDSVSDVPTGPVAATGPAVPPKTMETAPAPVSDTEEEDDMKFFQDLANQD